MSKEIDYWDPDAVAREDNRKRTEAWVARWRRMSAQNLQDYIWDLEQSKGGAGS